jgi:fucose permease
MRSGPPEDYAMTMTLPPDMEQPTDMRARMAGRAGLGLLLLVFIGFISLGLPDGLLGVGWPSIRHEFGLPLDALGPLLIMAMAGYLIASLVSGWVVERTGVGLLLALSCLLTAVGLFGYTVAPVWPVMVVLGLVAGLGAGAIDAGLNSYVALHHSSRLLNWLHACFGVGAATGPVIMTAVLVGGQSWRLGYGIVGGGQLALAICFLLTLKQWQTTPSSPGAASTPRPPRPQAGEGEHAAGVAAPRPYSETGSTPSRGEPLARPRGGMLVVVLSVLLFFLYTGIETAAGQWSYSLFVEGRAVDPRTASLWVSIFWGALAVGRVLSGIVANRLSAVFLVRAATFGLLLGAVLLWLDLSQWSSFVGLGLMGLAAATVFPTLIAATPERVGPKRASRVIGYEVGAAALGIGGIPALGGVLAARAGLEAIPLLLVVATAVLVVLHEAVVRAADRAFADG